MTRYPFDTADADERARLQDQSALWDPFSFRKLAETGVGEGWRCLEVGAGTGSVAAWLVDRVGRSGSVVATDIETRWLEPMQTSTLEVRHHNLVADPIEPRGYDLVHTRLLLEHLPPRPALVAKLVAALRPGGWLVVEDQDIRSMATAEPDRPAWAKVNAAVIEVLRATGSDPRYGWRLRSLLHGAGLDDVTAEGFVRPMTIPELAPAYRPALVGLRDRLLASGGVTEAEIDDALAAFDDHGFPTTTYTPILVAATGRRPLARPEEEPCTTT